MARDYAVLNSHHPRSIAPATIHIAHVQLRDLVICPREPGVVNYVQHDAIVEQDLRQKDAPTRTLATPSFSPNSLTSLPTGPSGNDTLLASGGQDAEIHISYHTPRSSRPVWDMERKLPGSINNSVLLTSLSLSPSHESSLEPRVGVSNNDGSFRIYDIPLRVHNSRRNLLEVGAVKFGVPINHASISPDGRSLLSVGDSSKVYCHRIAGSSSRVDFQPIMTLNLPPPEFPPDSPFSNLGSSLAASFSTAFSGDGSKFAVASQEGVVAVWDVRSTKPLKVFQTDKTRTSSREMTGAASGWLADDPSEWTRGTKAPGWCVRTVKFNGAQGRRSGREVMTFTEHSNLVHVVDARTFEKDDVIRIPTVHRPPPAHSSRARPSLSPIPRRRIVSTSRNRSTIPSSGATTASTDSSPDNANDAPIASSPIASPSPAPQPTLQPELPIHTSTSDHAAQVPLSGPVRLQLVARALGYGSTHANTNRMGASRNGSSSGVLQALSDTFRIELPVEADTLGTSSSPGSAQPQAIPTTPNAQNRTPPALSPTNSQGSGRSAYSPPASIGDSTLRTLGGAWPSRSSSNPNPQTTQPSSSTSTGPSTSTQPLQPESPTSPTSRRSESIYVIPPFGDRSMESGLRDLVAMHGFTRYSGDTTSDADRSLGTSSDPTDTDATGMDFDLAGVESAAVDALWDLFQGIGGDTESRSDGHSASSPAVTPDSVVPAPPSSSIRPAPWQPETADSSVGGPSTSPLGRLHIARAGQTSDLARLGHYGNDADPAVVTMMEIDENEDGAHPIDGAPDSSGMDVDADGEDDTEFAQAMDTWIEDDPIRHDDGDETYAEEDDDEEDAGRGRRIRTTRASSNCSSTASSRSPSPLRLAPTEGSSRRYGNAAVVSSGLRTTFMPYTISPTDTPPRRPGTLSLSMDGFTPASLPLIPSSSSPTKRPVRPKLYHLGKDAIYGYHDELDIAGVCFDPSGERMYVANCTPRYKEHNGFGGYGYIGMSGSEAENTLPRIGAIVEWEIKGADKKWWVDEGWR